MERRHKRTLFRPEQRRMPSSPNGSSLSASQALSPATPPIHTLTQFSSSSSSSSPASSRSSSRFRPQIRHDDHSLPNAHSVKTPKRHPWIFDLDTVNLQPDVEEKFRESVGILEGPTQDCFAVAAAAQGDEVDFLASARFSLEHGVWIVTPNTEGHMPLSKLLSRGMTNAAKAYILLISSREYAGLRLLEQEVQGRGAVSTCFRHYPSILLMLFRHLPAPVLIELQRDERYRILSRVFIAAGASVRQKRCLRAQDMFSLLLFKVLEIHKFLLSQGKIEPLTLDVEFEDMGINKGVNRCPMSAFLELLECCGNDLELYRTWRHLYAHLAQITDSNTWDPHPAKPYPSVGFNSPMRDIVKRGGTGAVLRSVEDPKIMQSTEQDRHHFFVCPDWYVDGEGRTALVFVVRVHDRAYQYRFYAAGDDKDAVPDAFLSSLVFVNKFATAAGCLKDYTRWFVTLILLPKGILEDLSKAFDEAVKRFTDYFSVDKTFLDVSVDDRIRRSDFDEVPRVHPRPLRFFVEPQRPAPASYTEDEIEDILMLPLSPA